MRLTRRGWFVAGTVVVAFLAATAFGPRGLNAVVAPGLVALAAGALAIQRIDPPELTRELPRRGTRGETLTVRLRLRGASPFSGRLYDDVDLGLSASGNERRLTVDDTTLSYDLHLDERGERTVGPLTVEARDVLGLVSRTFDYPRRETLVVRPRVYPLLGPRREVLVALYGLAGDDRREFDQLRDYRRGDPLRDVHWRSSAKLPDGRLLVKQFAADEGARTVEVAATSSRGRADEMAEAAASIVLHLLDAGLEVGLTTPDGRLPPDDNPDHRDRLLDHLAVAGTGRLAELVTPDITVDATPERTAVDLSGQACTFDALAGAGLDAPRPAVDRPVVTASEGAPT